MMASDVSDNLGVPWMDRPRETFCQLPPTSVTAFHAPYFRPPHFRAPHPHGSESTSQNSSQMTYVWRLRSLISVATTKRLKDLE